MTYASNTSVSPEKSRGHIEHSMNSHSKWLRVWAAELRGVIGGANTAEQAADEIDRLEAELALLSDKACAAVVAYRAALAKLTDSFKYSTEVVTIAREALAAHETATEQKL
jgi:hypothetical protein